MPWVKSLHIRYCHDHLKKAKVSIHDIDRNISRNIRDSFLTLRAKRSRMPPMLKTVACNDVMKSKWFGDRYYRSSITW